MAQHKMPRHCFDLKALLKVMPARTQGGQPHASAHLALGSRLQSRSLASFVHEARHVVGAAQRNDAFIEVVRDSHLGEQPLGGLGMSDKLAVGKGVGDEVAGR